MSLLTYSIIDSINLSLSTCLYELVSINCLLSTCLYQLVSINLFYQHVSYQLVSIAVDAVDAAAVSRGRRSTW